MFIEYVTHPKKFVVELWATDHDEFTGFKEPYPEDEYVEVNDWCLQNLGYPARTAYNRFEFKKEKHLTLFILRWA